MRKASSLIVCLPANARAGHSDFRILMLKRNSLGTFKSVHVFPGGVIESSDGASTFGTPFGIDHTAYAVGAVREAFEECGIAIMDPAPKLSAAESKAWREKIHADASTFAQFCQELKTAPAFKHMLRWAHWITPVIEKKRFDTQFFLAIANADLSQSHIGVDGQEAVQMNWFTPQEALAAFQKKEISLFPPQFLILSALAKYQLKDLKSFVSSCTCPHEIEPIQPEPFSSESGEIMLLLPGDALHSTAGRKKLEPGARNRLKFGKEGITHISAKL